MLVLSRRVGQQIRIGQSVVVTLLKVERNRARIGVEAPAGIPVFRQELLEFDKTRPSAPPATKGQGTVHRNVPRVKRPEMEPVSGPRFLWDTAIV
jgi:carbon storage regulator